MLVDLKRVNIILLVLFTITDSSRLSEPIQITRGDQDIFENSKCSGGVGCNCEGLNAVCVQNCARCKCPYSYKTFLTSIGDHGRCVKDNYLLFFPEVWTNSFLVQEKREKMCIINGDGNQYIWKTNCDFGDPSQHWIWTHYNKLLHVNTSKCVEQSSIIYSSNQYYAVLKKCKTTAGKQRWNCDRNYFKAENSNWFMSYQNSLILVSSYNSQLPGLLWSRFLSHEKLCSKAFGCYEFANPSSAILVLNTDCSKQGCHGNRIIHVPQKSGRPNCFIVRNKLQFLDYDNWKQLPFIDRTFWITIKKSDTLLEWNLSHATQKWNGLILRLHFYCAQGPITPPPLNTNCIVIKFEGVHNYPTSSPSPDMSSTGNPKNTKNPTNTKKPMSTKNPADVSTQGETKTKTPSSQTKFLFSSSLSANGSFPSKERVEGGSSNVVIIVVCVVIIPLVLSGVLGIFFYLRRRRSIKRSSDSVNHDLRGAGAASRKPSSGDTLNPTYSPAGNSEVYQDPDNTGASQECELYESGDTPVYHYAKVDRETKPLPMLEPTYDYASNDEIRPATKYHSNDYSESPTDLRENKGKNVQNNPSPVYHTLDES